MAAELSVGTYWPSLFLASSSKADAEAPAERATGQITSSGYFRTSILTKMVRPDENSLLNLFNNT